MPRSATLNRPLALLAAVGLSMENLDGTIIQTAAPAMAHDFGVHAVDLNIAMTAYLLTVAVCVPVSGWLADRFGERRIFTTALAVFTIASALCAFAPSLPLLTAARVLQGVGGAMMVPVGRLAVLRGLDRRDLLDAMAYLTWPGLLAPVVAPALGGILTDTVGWPWIFLINIPFGLVAFIAALKIVPNTPQPEREGWTGPASGSRVSHWRLSCSAWRRSARRTRTGRGRRPTWWWRPGREWPAWPGCGG